MMDKDIKITQNIISKIDLGRLGRVKGGINVQNLVVMQKDQYCLNADQNPFVAILEMAPENRRMEWAVDKLIEAALAITGSKAGAARYLGMNRTTIRERQKRLKDPAIQNNWEVLTNGT